MTRLLGFIINILFKGEFEMMTMFFAQRIVLGKTVFDDVPQVLKSKVAENLIDSGLDFLVPTEFGGTKQETIA